MRESLKRLELGREALKRKKILDSDSEALEFELVLYTISGRSEECLRVCMDACVFVLQLQFHYAI